MKKIKLTLLFILSFNLVNAQWIRQDHLLHATGSACLSGLTYCAVLKKDKAYTLLNGFWILVGIIGIVRAGGWI